MGSFSTICAISGLPIAYADKIVGFKLEPHRWTDTGGGRHKFAVAGLPITGEYDTYGGLEGEDLGKCFALVHWDIWQNAKKFWHCENRSNNSGWLRIDEAKQDAKRAQETDSSVGFNRDWNKNDYLYYTLQRQFTSSDYGLVFREMIEGQDVTGYRETKQSYLARSIFMEAILTKINLDTWSDNDLKNVEKLICFYSGEMLTGRAIRPSNDVWPEQCPDYKQRINLLKLFTKTAEKLQSRLNKNRD